MRGALLLVVAPLLNTALLPGADYSQEIAKFRADREKSLTRKDGWTTVVGLSWLKPGDNRIGSDPAAEVPLPASVPTRLGVLSLKAGHVQFQPAAGIKLVPQELKENGTPVTMGTVSFFVIRRGEQFGIRVKDSQAKTRTEFTHLSWYPVDASWRVTATFTPWDKPHALSFDTVIPGLTEQDQSPGYVSFKRDGKEYRLEPTLDDGELSFVFRDLTAGKTTYAASRFLDIPAPKNLKTPGTVVLDFNEAYNPPCVFTAYATCPLAPPQNRLLLAVPAGEKMYGNQH
jgi:hypothetical protein